MAIMPIPLLAPLVVTAAAAAAAGWVGARWWSRWFGNGPGRLADPAGASDGSGQQPTTRQRAQARTMNWCAGCGAYVLPERAADCTQPGCRFRR